MNRRILCLMIGDWPKDATHWPRPTRREDDSEGNAKRSLRDVLAERLTRYTPSIAPNPLDDRALILDITGLSHLISSESALIRDILADCEDLGTPPVRIAFGDTIGMAGIFAREPAFLTEGVAASPPLSRVYWIPPGRGIAFLRRYPITALGFRREVAVWCRELGIRTVADFMEIPADEVAAKFGLDTRRRWEEILGHRAELLPAWQPPEERSVTQWLEYPSTSPEALAFCLQRAVELLVFQPARKDLGITRLKVAIHCEDGGNVEEELEFFTPAVDPRGILEVIHLRLERRRFSAAVSGVRLEALETAPLNLRPRPMFEEWPGEVRRTERWGRLAERLVARLGEDRVLQPVLRAEYEPELAWRGVPLFTARKQKRNRRHSPPLPEVGPRPTRLYARPIPIPVVAAHPDGPPYRCFYEGKWFSVVRAWGPERIETGWWRGRLTARDYYRTEWENGSHFWLYRRLQDARWFLHGRFD
ncbi:MAG: DNA polymerase Y family protein [Thermogutta sp.]